MEHPGFGRRIGRDLAGHAQTEDRSHIDDTPPGASLDHPARGGLGDEEDTRQIGVDDAVPVLNSGLERRALMCDAGVVDNDVEGAVRLREQGINRLRHHHVQLGYLRDTATFADLGGQLLQRSDPARGNRDLRPRRGENFGEMPAETGRCPGDQRGFSLSVQIHSGQPIIVGR